MHAVLDLQADWPDAQNYQTLKQRLGQTCFGGLLTHHHRAELAVITYQNQLWKKGHQNKMHMYLLTELTQQLRNEGSSSGEVTTRTIQVHFHLRSSYLFGPQDHRHHALGFSGLGALINQDRAELHLGQTRIPCPDAGTADHVGVLREAKE